jgi:hypothetical protein
LSFRLTDTQVYRGFKQGAERHGSSTDNAKKLALFWTLFGVAGVGLGLVGGVGLLATSPANSNHWWLALGVALTCSVALVVLLWQQTDKNQAITSPSSRGSMKRNDTRNPRLALASILLMVMAVVRLIIFPDHAIWTVLAMGVLVGIGLLGLYFSGVFGGAPTNRRD